MRMYHKKAIACGLRTEDIKSIRAYYVRVGKWELYGDRTEPSRWGARQKVKEQEHVLLR